MRYSSLMNVVTDPLHELIHSMTQGEKRHFSIYSKRHVVGERNTYSILFDAISKQAVYDEKKLLRKFAGQKMTNNFSAAKHQLYQLILEGLRSFHAGKSVDSELRGLLEKVEVLFNKGLIKQCSKLLQKARKTAVEYERYISLLEVILWERRVHSKSMYSDLKAFHALHDEEREALEKIDNAGAMLNLYVSSFTQLVHAGRSRSEEATIAFKALLEDPLLADESKALSYPAKVFYHSVHANYNDSIGNDVVNNKHQQRLIELVEEHPQLLRSDFSRYITFVDNFCISGIRLGRYEECLKKLDRLHAIHQKHKAQQTPAIAARVFSTIAMHRLCAYYRQGKFEEGLKVVPEVEANWETYHRLVLRQRRHDLMFDLFYTYFGCGQFQQALHWLNACMNDKDITIRAAEASLLRLLEIVVHYELGNTDLVSFLVRNTYRFLLNKGQLFDSEALFLKYIRTRLPKVFDRKDLMQVLTDLRNELMQLQENPYEQQFLDPFDMIGWLNSKIEGRRFGSN